jgi:hypothetical protein
MAYLGFKRTCLPDIDESAGPNACIFKLLELEKRES